MLLGILLAKWMWVLLAPASAAMPATTVWKKTDDAERLFGVASASGTAAAAPFGNMQLVGVFAHRSQGFAVLQTQGKQVGVGLGEEVAPGVRLVETQANYVILERGGVRQRVDLVEARSAAGISAAPVAAAPAVAPATVSAAAEAPAQPVVVAPVSQFEADAAAALMDKLPPEQRETLRRKIEMMRSPH